MAKCDRRRVKSTYSPEIGMKDGLVLSARGIPASILLILRIGTGAVQGRYQKTRLGADLSIGNWVLILVVARRAPLRDGANLSILGGDADSCRSPSELRYGSGDVIDFGRGC